MSTIPTEVPGFAGCPWPVDPACLSDEWEAYEDFVRERALALASATLSRLTAYRVGQCPVTVRPQPQRAMCLLPSHYGQTGLYLPALGLYGSVVYTDRTQPWEIALPGPITRLDEVKIDGSVQSLNDFRIEEKSRLVWQGAGEVPWPNNQDLRLPDTEPGTFSVTYLNTYPVDSLGAYAAGVLATEFAKACTGARGCRLPSGVTSIVRQGVSMEITQGAFPDGVTGIREVDSFIALYNPRGRTQASRVYVPGGRRG